MKLKIKNLFIKIIILTFGFSIFRILGSDTRCLLKNKIGIPCPGCGMTRALESFLHGDIKKAFYYHPLFLIPIFIAIVFLFGNNDFFAKLIKNKNIWIFLVILVLLVYIIRMVLMFPDVAPMNYVEPIWLSFF
ncbi:DUF2752 domain-containing protein [Paraclostridium sordellii]|uniref:DUF2752 domain-containing protein n=1 Tax=Paraclostridium sordellii TaxID=1505 RepID=UPI0005DCF596|nr:DUF2752 domain-containing protein [Paeniclostridium sordellii]CEO08340.1 Protein of uncharacterised function (DUF2752) [[Clostridium] sordellii] [Paeniclostridium sordellii]CEP87175.1 Protein of uncharacterised function (DUF2752) [[Clostridium] sordellii] [Paeniclostridium sordellii]CEP95510.1 Protein of uncharacterised function (DUF2752) [[Clostridium] sordellii] [Paeniclostridium sordellii]CEP99148.1 Protein of uncharacterised function (DUF2752) [[Clostridium] sordellii] [Paeniclostridium 